MMSCKPVDQKRKPYAKAPSALHKDSRVRYWNEDYVQYWQSRVSEANTASKTSSEMVLGDSLTSADTHYENAINLLEIDHIHYVLELGCGFGRSLRSLARRVKGVMAVDISEQMIAAAMLSNNEKNIEYYVSSSESLPFESGSFDRIVCFAAFDAMFQTEALFEMSRVCKIGGLILITGKNDSYHLDDEKALDAEIGARRKGHPNYFTDVAALIGNLNRFGLRLKTAKYYEYRGDFSLGREIVDMPERFYEYVLVLSKISDEVNDCSFALYSGISKTYPLIGKKRGER